MMKPRMLGALLMIAMFATPLAMADSHSKTHDEKNPEAGMQEMIKLGTPGEFHKQLDAMAGKWEHTVKWWMDPNGQPNVMNGTNENKWILGGRFLQQTATSPAKDQMPPFEGMGLTGYDNLKKEYSSIWIDNMGTGMMMASGQWDKKTNAIVEKGSFADAMTGNKHQTFRGVCKMIDNDHYTYEMWLKDKKGKEFKSMEISYSRAK